MKIFFIRHGKPDYSLSDQRKHTQLEKEFSPLDRKHLYQVEHTANDPHLCHAEIMLSSPYTRALQTAEILNRRLQLPLFVEYDLHEWKADLSGQYLPLAERDCRWEEYKARKGIYPHGETREWETCDSVWRRVRSVLLQYRTYHSIIVVCHWNVIVSQTRRWDEAIPFAGIAEYDLLE